MTAALEAVALTFAYPRSPPLLRDWSQGFHTGALTCLTGPSGKGKSTLLYLLGTLLTPQSGAVLVDGINSTAMNDRDRSELRARQLGFVFQDASLDQTRSVLDNVTEPVIYRGEKRADATGRALDLLARLDVDVPATRKPGQISGGQAQRIALCRGLLHDPLVLLADEPTGNLDTPTAKVVLSALRAHADGGGVVIIATHDERVTSVCDNRVLL